MYTITSIKRTETAKSIGSALRVAGDLAIDLDPSFNTSITRDDTGESATVELRGPGTLTISVAQAQDLLRLAGIDPRPDDADGFHWPYAPSIEQAAEALDCWTA